MAFVYANVQSAVLPAGDAPPVEVIYVALGYCVVMGLIAALVVKKMSQRIVCVL